MPTILVAMASILLRWPPTIHEKKETPWRFLTDMRETGMLEKGQCVCVYFRLAGG